MSVYFVAITFFIWGVVTGKSGVFPWKQIAPLYNELYQYLSFKEGPEKSIKENLLLDHQERRSVYNFSGLRVRDNDFRDTGYLLIARYSNDHNQAIVDLFSISENRVLHTWAPPQSEIFDKSTNLGPDTRTLQTFRVQHPLLLQGGDLIFTTGEGPLVRIDACGAVKWVLSRHFHHSIEVDHQGNLITGIVIQGEGNGTEFPVRDDGIAIVDFDGRIIKEYSVLDILLKNGYRGLIYGVGPFEKDRIHLNDAHPVLRDSVGSKTGDILLSIRNLSTVALFEPVTGRIKWLKTGPWLRQHDINPLEDNRFSIFGNDVLKRPKEELAFSSNGHSDIYIYDKSTEEVTRPFTSIIQKEQIRSKTGGRLDILENGDAFIEETTFSRLIRISNKSVRWEYVNGISEDTVGAIHWSRYIPNEEINVEWLENQTCR